MIKVLIPMLVAAVLSGCRSVGTVESPQGERPYVGKLLVGTDKSVSLRTERTPFRLGVARYSLVNTPFERGLDIVEAIDCHYMSFIEGSLPRDATDAQIAEYKARLAARGIEVDTLGPCYFGDEKTVESAFAFAKRYGMKMISVVPYETHEKDGKWQNYESDAMLDVLEKMVRKYDIKAAIHNHGPDMPNLYPVGESVWKRIANRDKRIGFCFDIGHQARSGGGDPAKFIREHADRIYDVHLKNIKIDPGKNLAKEGPRGELDILGVLTALAEVGYDGTCHIEYEKDRGDNLVQLAESVGYYRGIMEAVGAKAR